MTKGEIKAAICDAIDNASSTLGDTETPSQAQLTLMTDAAAGELDTVNPNGPHYPSTPR